MRRLRSLAIASIVLASFTSVSSAIASADAANSPLTVQISPVYTISTIGDGGSPLPVGSTPLNTIASPRGTNDLRLDYGLSYQLSKHSSFSYSHTNFDFTLGRISTPSLYLLSGDIQQRTDTFAYNYNLGHGLAVDGYYWSTQRISIAGACINQEFCTSPTTGLTYANPGSIDETGYGVGATYGFGGGTLQTGPLFTVGVDAKYYVRPSYNATSSLNGLPAYKGSQTLFPYSITFHVPLVNKYGLLPFVGYARTYDLYRNESAPETYNLVQWGFVKNISRGLSVSYTNMNFRETLTSDTVPTPDNLRFTDAIFRINYAFKPATL